MAMVSEKGGPFGASGHSVEPKGQDDMKKHLPSFPD